MPLKKRLLKYVIFDRRQRLHGSNRYIAADGTPTSLKKRAAKFDTFSDAQRFAIKQDIELTHSRHIGVEELSRRWDM